MPYLWYAVPFDAPDGPATIFVDRFWDNMHGDHFDPDLGVVAGSQKAYMGVPPAPGLTPVEGTPDQWVNGFDYEAYLRGEYPVGSCLNAPPAYRSREGQGQAFRVLPYRRATQYVEQVQAFVATVVVGGVGWMAEAQAFPSSVGVDGVIRQAQGTPRNANDIAEAQAFPATEILSANEVVAQVQTAEGVVVIDQVERQAQSDPDDGGGVTHNGTTDGVSNQLYLDDVTGVVAGQVISGPCVPPGTTVGSVTGPPYNQVSMSASSTCATSGVYTFT